MIMPNLIYKKICIEKLNLRNDVYKQVADCAKQEKTNFVQENQKVLNPYTNF